MSLLSHNELLDLIDNKIVEHADKELVNSSSLDIRLGSTILIERTTPSFEVVEKTRLLSTYPSSIVKKISLRKREPLHMVEWDLEREGPFTLAPGAFILAHSHEVFNLPNTLSAMYALKSSMARIGLEHLSAGWCDAGWNGSVLTLELKNLTQYHEIELVHMDKIGQMIFMKHREVPEEKSYAIRGRYNGDRTVSGAKVTFKEAITFEAEEGEME